ncbi:MAG: hypothetical protein AAGI30_02920 [Planctomycetota bacterium]
MIVAMFAFWIVPLGLSVLAIILSIMNVVRACTRPVGAGKHAACGSCGYELNALAQHGAVTRCPECGADLLKAGVVTPNLAMRMGGSLAAAVLGWTILTTTITGIGYGIAISIGMAVTGGGFMSGTPQPLTKQVTIEPQSYNRGNATDDYAIDFDIDVQQSSFFGPAQSGTVTIELFAASASVATAELDVSTGDWVLTDAAGAELARTAVFDAATADTLLAEAHLPLTDPAISNERDQLVDLARDAPRSPDDFETNLWQSAGPNQLGGLQSRSVSSASGGFNPFNSGSLVTELWIPLASLLIGLTLYITGLVLIVRRRRSITNVQMRSASPAPSTSPPPDPPAMLPA